MPWGMAAPHPHPMAMIGFEHGSPWGPASMSSFLTWEDDTAADTAAGEETSGRGDESSFVTIEEPLAGDEGMPADFLAGHWAHSADVDEGAK